MLATSPARSIGYVVRGTGGQHPGSAQVRVVRRIALDSRPQVSYHRIDVDQFVAGRDERHYDVILVQRDAVAGRFVDAFVAEAGARTTPIVVELDDDLLTDEARSRLIAGGYSSEDLDGLRALVAASSRILVSTKELAKRVRALHSDVVIVENALDPEIWGSRVRVEPPPPRNEVRALYMGSATHVADLHLLRPVFTDLRTHDGRAIVLEVIGVTHHDEEWFRRIPMPDGTGNYPQLVQWLRTLAPRWSLGVAPLEDEFFNKAKSDLKFLEYTMLGLPTIASAVESYHRIPDHGGRVVPNDTQAWRQALVASTYRFGRTGLNVRRAAKYVRGARFLGRDGWNGILP